MFRTGIKILKNDKNFQIVRLYCEMPFNIKKFALPSRYVDAPNVWVDYALLAAEHQPVNLGMGFPDFCPPKWITKHLEVVARDADICLQMKTCNNGHPRLCEILASFFSKLINIKIDPKCEVFVSCGAYAPLYCSVNAHCQEGDEVIVIDPSFNCYEPQVRSSGACPIFVPLRPSGKGTDASDWGFDDYEFSQAFTKRTKMILLNTPHNPTGKIFTQKEMERIAELCIKWNVICVCDEVYEWHVFDPHKHIRMCTLPSMWDRTITIGSSGKTFGLTGWKTGWAYGPQHLMRNIYQVHRNCVGSHCTPVQEAIARAFEVAACNYGTPECYFKPLREIYKRKAEFLYKALKEVNLKPVMPHGGYFILADWTGTAHRCNFDEEKDPFGDFKFTKWLTKNWKVQFTPASAFYSECNKKLGENFIRACLIKTDDTLQKAAKNLCAWQEWARSERLE